MLVNEALRELFGHNHKRFASRKKNLLPTITFGVGSVMLWGCMASTGTGKIVKVEGRMDSTQYQQILGNNLQDSVRKLKLCRGWLFQQDNNPKHCSKSTKEFMQRHRYNVLEWPSQFPATLGARDSPTGST